MIRVAKGEAQIGAGATQLDRAPETPPGFSRLALQLHEELLVALVRRDGHHVRVAQTNQLGVDHRVADPDVGQKPSPAIPRPHIELEADAAAFDEAAIDGGRLAAAGLFTLDRMMDLGTVDADVANFLDAVSELNEDGVAVDDAHDRALDRDTGAGATEQRHEQQQHEPPSRGRHAATVSPRIGTCQDLETEDGEPARKVARRGLLDAEHGVAERLQLSVDERLMAAVAAPPVDGLPVGLGHAAVTTRTAIQEDLDVLFRLELAREVLAEADLVSR